MTDIQRDAYGDATEVYSDALGVIPRDNRNHRKKQDLIVDWTHATRGDRVLEVGCGHGLHAQRYADRFDYTGIDLSESLVEETQATIESGTAVQMDAMKLGFADNEFDAVVGTAILHHLPRQEQALSEWVRVTKTGGSVTLMEPNYLFPKGLLSAHLVAEERHKRRMALWRLRQTVDAVADDYIIEPRIYTLPWPTGLAPVYDRVDDLLRRAPLLRHASMMHLIHIRP